MLLFYVNTLILSVLSSFLQPYVEFSSLDRITSIKVEEAMPEMQVNLANIDSDANVGDTDQERGA